MSIKITVVLPGAPDEDYLVTFVPRIGELIRTEHRAAARVTDVAQDLVTGKVTVYAQ